MQADEEPWGAPSPSSARRTDEMPQENPGHFEVEDGAVSDGLDHLDALRRSALHVPGRLSDGPAMVEHLGGAFLYGEVGRLFADNAPAAHAQPGGRCAQVDGCIGGKQTE